MMTGSQRTHLLPTCQQTRKGAVLVKRDAQWMMLSMLMLQPVQLLQPVRITPQHPTTYLPVASLLCLLRLLNLHLMLAPLVPARPNMRRPPTRRR